jgi:hypothetical protein
MHLDDAEEGTGALKIAPACRNKKLSTEEISLVSQSCTPAVCDVSAEGIHMMKP